MDDYEKESVIRIYDRLAFNYTHILIEHKFSNSDAFIQVRLNYNLKNSS